MLLVIVVRLIPPPPIPLPENSDKGEHFVAYYPGRQRRAAVPPRPLLWVGVALVLMGIGIEFAQAH